MIEITIKLDLEVRPEIEDYVEDWATTYLVPIFQAKCLQRRDDVLQDARAKAAEVAEARRVKLDEARRRVEAAQADLMALQEGFAEEGDPLIDAIDQTIQFEASTDHQHENNTPFTLEPDPEPKPKPPRVKRATWPHLLMDNFEGDPIAWAVFGPNEVYDIAAQIDPERPWAWRVRLEDTPDDRERWTGGFVRTEVDAIRLAKSSMQRLNGSIYQTTEAIWRDDEEARAEAQAIGNERTEA